MALVSQELSGGLAIEEDLVLPGRPADPEIHESASIWLVEENGAFAFPRGGIEAEGRSWYSRPFQGQFAFPDGRVLVGDGKGPAPAPFGPDGRPTVIGGGALTFHCIEQFRRWTAVFDGPALDGTVAEQIAGTFGAKGIADVRMEADMEMVTPAWIQAFSEGTQSSAGEAADAAARGFGCRFEQLFRATGMLALDGRTRTFRATGLRIHRKSVRRLGGFHGHCWQSALFPDGRAFGVNTYPPRADGSPSYNDGFVYQDGRMYKARSIRPPFLRRLVASGDDVTLELESELGVTRIEGSTTHATFRLGNSDINGLDLQQGAALYRWGDQSAYGMIERSSASNLTSVG